MIKRSHDNDPELAEAIERSKKDNVSKERQNQLTNFANEFGFRCIDVDPRWNFFFLAALDQIQRLQIPVAN